MPTENDFDRQPQKPTPEDVLSNKIVTYYGYFKEHSLKSIAKTCAKMMISEHYRDLCFDNFKFPSFEETKLWILEEMKQNFDEKVVPLIEQAYPHLSEEELEDEIVKLEKKYEEDHEKQLISTTKEAVKELQIRVEGLQKELKDLKRKYTI